MTKNTQTTSTPELFSPDRPIERRGEDVLGRRAFSEALARAIKGWSGRESLVLALYGAWGNGKSSIKNMVIDVLESESPQVLIVDFNPWQLANRPTLSAAFFDELCVALGKGDVGSESRKKDVLARFQRWSHRLQGGRDFFRAVRDLFGYILVGFGCLAVLAGLSRSRVTMIVLGGLLVAGGILAFASRFIDAAIKFLEAGTEVGSKSLGEVKAEIAKDLRTLKTPILVVLDDVDRLTPAELLEVFQLIKANADFPNLIYLVLCEREIVERNIHKTLNVPGREYLEKVVQVAFDVPMIDAARVHQVLFDRLDLLLSFEAISAHFSQKRWANVFLSGLRGYFPTLRDVNRFMSTVAFHFSSLSTAGAFEVNPIDLIVLETIRLYEPTVYEALRSNKELLTAGRRPDKPQSEAAAETVTSIIQMGSKERQKELRELIKHLFPTIEWALGGTQYASEYGEQWYRDLRICSAKMFDRYFRLAISEQELSQSTVQSLLESCRDRDQLRSKLESLHSRALLSAAIEELAVYEDQLTPDQVEPFITGLLDVADRMLDEKTRTSDIPPHIRVWFLIRKSVEKLSDISVRSQVITNALTNTKGLFMAAEFVALAATPENDSDKGILPVSEVVALQALAVAKIEERAVSGELEQHSKLALLLSLWQGWGKPEQVANYIETLTANPRGTLQLLKSFMQRSVRQSVSDYVGTERFYIRRKDVEVLIPMDTLDELVQQLPSKDLSPEDRRAVMAFEKTMERRKLGKSDDDPFAED